MFCLKFREENQALEITRFSRDILKEKTLYPTLSNQLFNSRLFLIRTRSRLHNTESLTTDVAWRTRELRHTDQDLLKAPRGVILVIVSPCGPCLKVLSSRWCQSPDLLLSKVLPVARPPPSLTLLQFSSLPSFTFFFSNSLPLPALHCPLLLTSPHTNIHHIQCSLIIINAHTLQHVLHSLFPVSPTPSLPPPPSHHHTPTCTSPYSLFSLFIYLVTKATPAGFNNFVTISLSTPTSRISFHVHLPPPPLES